MEQVFSKIHSTVPVIGTDDVKKSIKYYTEVLGFSFDFEYGDPVVYAGVKSGNAEIYFSHDPEIINAIKEKKFNPEIFIWLPDADNLFKEHVKNGAEIIETISDRPWGARQYVVKDINGYHLKFAQAL
jgi:uncharacterized glyoxalase superfamily protein PhnB